MTGLRQLLGLQLPLTFVRGPTDDVDVSTKLAVSIQLETDVADGAGLHLGASVKPITRCRHDMLAEKPNVI